MIYEIINMSDSYTIEAHSLDIAFVACLLLGGGQYAFRPIDGEPEIPLFLFGGCESWCRENLGAELETVVDSVTTEPTKRLALAECFESCLIGTAEDRETYHAGLNLIDDPAKRERWRSKWHDDRRSSMNDIGGRAYEMATRLRDGAGNPLVDAPRQVFTK